MIPDFVGKKDIFYEYPTQKIDLKSYKRITPLEGWLGLTYAETLISNKR